MSNSSITILDSYWKKILVFLIVFSIIDAVISVFGYSNNNNESGVDTRSAVTDIEVMLTSGIAAGFATIVFVRQGFGGLHGRAYTALMIGAIAWFAGEILWVYHEVGLQIELPTFSLADASWLFGYGFFGYYLFRMYIYFAKTVNRRAILIVSIIVGLLIAYMISQMMLALNMEASDDVMTFVVRTFYSIGDFVMIVPSILLLVTLRKAKLHFSPWFFTSIALLVTAAADSMFSYVTLVNQIEIEWIANLLYDSANLSLAGGLYWYYRFVVFNDEKKQVANLDSKKKK